MSLPSVVGVYGGGRMGAGIAHAFLVSGAQVVVIERDDDAATAARHRVARTLTQAQQRGTVDDAFAVLDRFTVSSRATDLRRCSLIIEAVPEDPALKAGVLRVIEDIVPGAALATNTSSLSIDALASYLTRPEQLLGLHFFNPVPVSDLVEIVVGARTAPGLVTQAKEWVTALGKTAITVRDSPGFASSRLGVMLALEAMCMLEEGVASAADIDTAMTLGYRHPVGPLKTTDVVGLDVRLAIAEHLSRELGPRFEPPQLLRALVGAGHLGMKSGQGFFSWPTT